MSAGSVRYRRGRLPLLLGSLLASAAAVAALPWAVSGQGTGGSVGAALSAAQADAQAKCQAMGRAPASNLVMTDYHVAVPQHWVRVEGNCGGLMPVDTRGRQ